MARNLTLTQLLDKYRTEARLSLNPAHNLQVRDSQVGILQRHQERLWNEHNWPHMRVRKFVPLQAGQRYYDSPSPIPIDRIENISIKYGGEWIPLTADIGDCDMSVWDSDAGDRAWPVERWRISEENQIEVWPIPASDGEADDSREGHIRVTGIRNLQNLVADDDRCDIDGDLIVMFAAAETLAGSGAKDAQLKLKTAERMQARLIGNWKPLRQYSILQGSRPVMPMRRGPPTVHYRDNET